MFRANVVAQSRHPYLNPSLVASLIRHNMTTNGCLTWKYLFVGGKFGIHVMWKLCQVLLSTVEDDVSKYVLCVSCELRM